MVEYTDPVKTNINFKRKISSRSVVCNFRNVTVDILTQLFYSVSAAFILPRPCVL